jgi:hypothetical protein
MKDKTYNIQQIKTKYIKIEYNGEPRFSNIENE